MFLDFRCKCILCNFIWIPIWENEIRSMGCVDVSFLWSINIYTSTIEGQYSAQRRINPLSANPEKWSDTLKQIVGNSPTICLSVFDHFMNLALKGLRTLSNI